jgi:hypothetical protein
VKIRPVSPNSPQYNAPDCIQALVSLHEGIPETAIAPVALGITTINCGSLFKDISTIGKEDREAGQRLGY